MSDIKSVIAGYAKVSNEKQTATTTALLNCLKSNDQNLVGSDGTPNMTALNVLSKPNAFVRDAFVAQWSSVEAIAPAKKLENKTSSENSAY